MLRTLAPRRTGAARAARAIMLASAAVVAVAALAYGWPVSVNDPIVPGVIVVHYVEKDADYVAWVNVFAPRHVVGGSYGTNGTADRIVLLRDADLPRLLAGEDVQPIQELDVSPIHGRIAYAPPPPDCRGPDGGCDDASQPILVFVKGSAWKGMDRAKDLRVSETTQTIGFQQTSWSGGQGPVAFGYTAAPLSTLETGRWAQPVGFAAMGLGALASLAWSLLEARATRAEGRARLTAPAGASTEEMLRLVRLTGLYVESIRRSLLVSALAIVGTVVVLLAFAVPAVLRVASEAFAYMPDAYFWTLAFFACVPPFFGLVCLAHWTVSYVRVRLELRHWRDMGDRFDRDAAALLGG